MKKISILVLASLLVLPAKGMASSYSSISMLNSATKAPQQKIVNGKAVKINKPVVPDKYLITEEEYKKSIKPVFKIEADPITEEDVTDPEILGMLK